MIAALSGLIPQAASAASGPVASAAASFEDALGQAFGSVVDSLKTGEAMAIQGIQSAAPPIKVAEAVMEAQRSLQSMLTIRDKVVSAWQEVSHMAI
jgi:flagellar hook-basal body complex protein FliE